MYVCMYVCIYIYIYIYIYILPRWRPTTCPAPTGPPRSAARDRHDFQKNEDVLLFFV